MLQQSAGREADREGGSAGYERHNKRGRSDFPLITPTPFYVAGDAVDDESMAHLQGHAITYRIAVGPQQGRKVFTLKTLPACDPDDPDTVGRTAGISVHAGVAAKARERGTLDRLCRTITRPAV